MKYQVVSTVVVERLAKLKDQVLGETRKQIKEVAKSALDAVQLGAVILPRTELETKIGQEARSKP